MEREITVTLTTMCMICDGDRVLVQDRVKPDWSGLAFPGGHVEKGESFTDSVIREVREETGLMIEHPVLCGVQQWEHENGSRYITFFFKTSSFSGEIISSEEGKIFWIDRKDLSAQKTAREFSHILQIFERDDLSEFYLKEHQGMWERVFF